MIDVKKLSPEERKEYLHELEWIQELFKKKHTPYILNGRLEYLDYHRKPLEPGSTKKAVYCKTCGFGWMSEAIDSLKLDGMCYGPRENLVD
jgi:hypothetical protein